ncbi:MAG: amino acid ABC transporter ATP-binding protein [Actinobacteria bacterium]|nr:amino acid ABC transporter ATP-binding protein [Actinomycetota bacterium]
MVELAGVCKSFGPHPVLHDVDLQVLRGECVCIVGPSGSGKSTLLRCVNHLESPTSGRVVVNGHRMGLVEQGGKCKAASEGVLAKQRRETGMVFQRFNLFPHMTALENVISGLLRVQGRTRAEATPIGEALLARVGLGDKAASYPSELSGGQQQRVAIVRALAVRPTVMLFDEPTSALDPEMIGEVLGVIAELRADGMTMIIVTHEMKFARRTADWVVMMDEGRVVERARPDAFFDRPGDPRTQRFLSKVL